MRIFSLLPLAVVSVVLLGGCRGDGTPPPTLDPSVIQDAMDRTMESSLSLEATVGSGQDAITMTGVVDVAAGELWMTQETPGEAFDMMVVDDRVYLAVEGPLGEPWLSIDASRLGPESSLRSALDFGSYTGIVAGVTTVEQVGPGEYEGLIDLNKAVAEFPEANLAPAASQASNASAVPYEARIDAEGRLTWLRYTIDMPPGPVVSEIEFGDFGQATDIEAPPAEDVWEAPDDLYEGF